MKISYSLLGIDSLDFGESFSQIAFDAIHLDIMDGHAVQNLGLPPWIIPAIRQKTKVEIQAHLMVNPTESFVELVGQFHPEIIFFHPNWCRSPELVAESIRKHGAQVGIVWNDDGAEAHFGLADQILFMTVQPGRPGQALLQERIEKISTLKLDKPFWLDGGINSSNFELVSTLKPTGIIAGKGIFGLQKYF